MTAVVCETIAQYFEQGYRLLGTCIHCRRRTEIDLGRLARRRGSAKLADVRFRCVRCKRYGELTVLPGDAVYSKRGGGKRVDNC